MYKILIVEDDYSSAKLLQDHLSINHSNFEVVGIAKSSEMASLLYQKYKPDILLLDIQLGNGLVFEFLKVIDRKDTHIVFISAFDQFGVESIVYQPFAYLLKPLDLSDFDRIIIQLIKEKQGLQEHLYSTGTLHVSSSKKVDYIPFYSILYVVADGAYSTVYCKSKSKSIVSLYLKKIAEQLPIHHFIRIHSKYLVNINEVVSIHKDHGYSCELSNGDILPISRRKSEYVLSLVSQRNN